MEARLRQLKATLAQQQASRTGKSVWRAGTAGATGKAYTKGVREGNAQRRARPGGVRVLRGERDGDDLTSGGRPKPQRSAPNPPSSLPLGEGRFDEAAGHTSFLEALEDWRAGVPAPAAPAPAPQDSLLHGTYDEEAAASSFKAAVMAWRAGTEAPPEPAPVKMWKPPPTAAAEHVAADCQTEPRANAAIVFKTGSKLTYIERLMLKRARAGELPAAEAPPPAVPRSTVVVEQLPVDGGADAAAPLRPSTAYSVAEPSDEQQPAAGEAAPSRPLTARSGFSVTPACSSSSRSTPELDDGVMLDSLEVAPGSTLLQHLGVDLEGASAAAVEAVEAPSSEEEEEDVPERDDGCSPELDAAAAGDFAPGTAVHITEGRYAGETGLLVAVTSKSCTVRLDGSALVTGYLKRARVVLGSPPQATPNRENLRLASVSPSIMDDFEAMEQSLCEE